MIKRHPHTAKKHTATHGDQGVPTKHTHQPRVVPMHSRQPREMEKEESSLFLTWPSHLFEMLLTPWHGLTPMEAWVEHRRAGGKPIFPKTQSKETHNAYHYLVELPGVSRDQIALNFQNGVIMLRVEEAEDQRKKNYHHSRAIRRAFSLPVYTDGEAITAELKDGILTIAIPKTDKPVSPKSRTITIA